ncbi:MAG: hypothetical protein ACP5H2_09485 [Solirubrobacteraceae bacterium]
MGAPESVSATFDLATPLISPSPVGVGVAGVGRVVGGAVRVPVSCRGSGQQACSVMVSLHVTETFRAGRLVGVAARAGHVRLVHRLVSVGVAPMRLAGGERKVLVVRLNATGERLLRARRMLPAELTVRQGSRTLRRQRLVLRLRKRKANASV